MASVLAQTHSDFELIVVNDGSADRTKSVIDAVAAKDKRIRALHLDTAQGAPAARNHAIDMAQGVYCTGLDDDDEFHPTRLADLLAAFDERHSLVCSGMLFHYGSWSRAVRNSAAVITIDQELSSDQVGTQILTLTDRLRAVGGFDPNMPAWQDYDLWLRLILRFGSGKRIAKVSYTQHLRSDLNRISVNGASGARKFLLKHGQIMTAEQRAGHELEALMIERKRLGISEFLRLTNKKTAWKSARYLIASNLPFIRPVSEAWREFRHRADKPLD